MDLVVGQNGGPAWVLINDVPQAGEILTVELRGQASNPQGFGALVEAEVGERRLVRWIQGARSYISQSPPRADFGLPAGTEVTLSVTWPAGAERRYRSLRPDALYILPE